MSIPGSERRQTILTLLKQTGTSMTGGELAQITKVSRQVIVQDIALLRAANYPILATPQGYLYQETEANLPHRLHQKVIAVQHTRQETEMELNTLVDHGVSVIDVIVEHPIYGELHGPLLLKNRRDVWHFIKKIESTGAALLSDLTQGVHLHTIAAETEELFSEACQALKEINILMEET